MSNLSNVTAIIKTFLRDEYLYRCIESLKSQYPEIKIFVADDGRFSDEKDKKLEGLGVDYYLKLPFHVGLPVGRNKLVKKVETDYFMIGDDDFIYTEKTDLTKMIALTDISDVVCGSVEVDGIVQHYEGQMITSDDKKGLIYVPDNTPFFNRHKDIRYKELELAFNFFIAKTHVREKAWWDEAIHVAYEHSDFFLMLREGQYKVVYTPDVIVQHRSPDIVVSEEYREYRLDKSAKNHFLKKRGFTYMIDMHGNLDRLDPEKYEA